MGVGQVEGVCELWDAGSIQFRDHPTFTSNTINDAGDAARASMTGLPMLHLLTGGNLSTHDSSSENLDCLRGIDWIEP